MIDNKNDYVKNTILLSVFVEFKKICKYRNLRRREDLMKSIFSYVKKSNQVSEYMLWNYKWDLPKILIKFLGENKYHISRNNIASKFKIYTWNAFERLHHYEIRVKFIDLSRNYNSSKIPSFITMNDWNLNLQAELWLQVLSSWKIG